jgi:hypothetical protein
VTDCPTVANIVLVETVIVGLAGGVTTLVGVIVTTNTATITMITTITAITEYKIFLFIFFSLSLFYLDINQIFIGLVKVKQYY